MTLCGENAAHGFGITAAICQSMFDSGVDVITLGNHAWDQREIIAFISAERRLLRPLNYPIETPGQGFGFYTTAKGRRVIVIQVMCRLFMDALDDPFAAVDGALMQCPLGSVCDAAIVDMHAEATSEKQAMGYFFDGRVSLVVGTHTHVPTADHRILPGGTAYMSDAGMTGDYESILGMAKEEPIRRFVEKTPGTRLEAANGVGTLSGVAVETDDRTGLAKRIAPVRLGPGLSRAVPEFWEADASGD